MSAANRAAANYSAQIAQKGIGSCGNVSGEIYYKGILQQELDEKMSACEIGYVLQNPDNQIVTDKVWHELAFGLENMGIPTDVFATGRGNGGLFRNRKLVPQKYGRAFRAVRSSS